MTWQGHTAVVADGDELAEIDCSRLLAAVAPVDITTRIERLEIVADAHGREVHIGLDDTGRAVLATRFNERPYGEVAVSVDGVVFSLGAVQFHADETEDALLHLCFEQPADLAQAA